jgi:hypothetical protein
LNALEARWLADTPALNVSGARIVNALLKLFLDRLTERLFSLVGSSIGSAATTYHAITQAEQQSQLEDLARQYEAEGKHDLAVNLRRQATLIANGDPASQGQLILQRITEQPAPPTGAADPITGGFPLLGQDPGRSEQRRAARPRRARPSDPSVNDDQPPYE